VSSGTAAVSRPARSATATHIYDLTVSPADRTGVDVPTDRLRRIQALTDSGLARLEVDELLAELTTRVRDLLEVDTVAVLLLDPSASYLVATATCGLEEEIRQGVRIPIGRGFAGRIAATRTAVVIREVDHSNVMNPILREKGVRSLLGVPLTVGNEVIGVLHVGTLRSHEFTPDDAMLLQMAADRVALATRARLSQAERSAAGVLQRSLLPGQLPAVPGLELAARYVPGGGGEVGGDWYDVFDLPSGQLCVVVGDVVGRGLQASVAMGRLRSAVRAYALLNEDPAQVLGRLDRQVQQFEPEVMATVLCAVAQPGHTEVTLSSAGHPPPVLAPPGGSGAVVDMPADPPIGLATAMRRRHNTVVELPAGSTLVLYTDGLVERRGERLDDGLERLAAAVVPGPAETVCAAVMSKLIGSEPSVDDVAVLVLSRTAEQHDGPLSLREPAVPSVLRGVRQAVREYLRRVGATEDEVLDIVLAIGEAVTNVLEHAYGPAGGLLELDVETEGRTVTATVRDTGHWREARGTNRGRGTAMMRGLVDEVSIDHDGGGTRVVLQKTLDG
jgi:anti-sigma regulatory factor (Ser/Thr protein kinase)/putative methionine-R-sulfoxide reductase with GAF domain